MTARKMFLIGSFLLFLYPVTAFENLSVNYSFAIFPVLTLLFKGRLRRLPTMVLAQIGLFTLIFAIAMLYQVDLLDLGFRRLGSFIVFMTLFAFVSVKIDPEMISAFKIALVVMSCYFSLMAIAIFFSANIIAPVGYEGKDLVGSQRYGFIYLLGLWISICSRRPGTFFALARVAVVGIILAGLFLTFSRSSIVGLMVTVVFFVLAYQWQWIQRPTAIGILKFGVLISAVGLLLGFLYHFFTITFVFYTDRIVDLVRSGTLGTHLVDPTTSEGKRVYIIDTILDFVTTNPVTGSGYLGVWTLSDSEAGSAHNQYIDVLLRTGPIGLAAYILILWTVLKHLVRHERDLFWGFLGFLVFGLFHETAKESQGAFALAFLFGMAIESQRSKPPRSLAGRTADGPTVESIAS